MGLNNAATSRILVNPAVILILKTTVNINFYLFCVNINSMLNTFHRVKVYRYFNFYQRLYSNLG